MFWSSQSVAGQSGMRPVRSRAGAASTARASTARRLTAGAAGDVDTNAHAVDAMAE